MGTLEKTTARIHFLAATRNEAGQITHYPGEIISGQVIERRGDFLLVRTEHGACMYVDASRRNLYCVEWENEAAPSAQPPLRVRDTRVKNLVVPASS